MHYTSYATKTNILYNYIKGNIVTAESRRDQEEADGAGPSREPRGDQEQGSGAGLRKLDIFCFSCYSATVLRTLSL